MPKEPTRDSAKPKARKPRSPVKAPPEESTASPRDRLLEIFDNLSVESQNEVLEYVVHAAARERAEKSNQLRRKNEPRVIEEWTDEEGNIFQYVEADDGLTPEQRMDAIAEILATIALRVMRAEQQNKASEEIDAFPQSVEQGTPQRRSKKNKRPKECEPEKTT